MIVVVMVSWIVVSLWCSRMSWLSCCFVVYVMRKKMTILMLFAVAVAVVFVCLMSRAMTRRLRVVCVSSSILMRLLMLRVLFDRR